MKNKPFFTRLFKFFKVRYTPRGAQFSFSGEGEDLIVKNIFSKLKIDKVFYIDVGAHHPVYGNNTYLFYINGGQGILVEPNKILCEEIRNKRPRDICLNSGVGSTDDEADFFSFKRNTRNTFSKKEAEAWEKLSGDKAKIVKQRIISLNSIINDHCTDLTPDFISIDTEGFEYEILMGFNWQIRPKIFCLEIVSSSKNINYSNLDSLMTKNGYVLCAKTIVNSIYIDKKYNL